MAFLNDFLLLLQQSQALTILCFAILGLCVGSFLNVVIHRTPLMLEQQWKAECQSYLYPYKTFETPPRITLSQPASRCPHCGHQIRWYENIPVISWLFLRGCCSRCQSPISVRYPLVEIFTAVMSVLVVLQFGVTLKGGSALVLTWVLIALAGIDFDSKILPDRFTLPLAGLGLLVNTQSLFVTPSQAIWGYVIGFMSLWLVYHLFLLLTGKRGMGYGDFKLLAALGAWLGAFMLPMIILLSSVIGTIAGLIFIRLSGENKEFAFGPYIAIAGVIALLYGQSIMQWYLG